MSCLQYFVSIKHIIDIEYGRFLEYQPGIYDDPGFTTLIMLFQITIMSMYIRGFTEVFENPLDTFLKT